MVVVISSNTFVGGQIGYKNRFRDSGVSVTASTEAAGFEKENIFDWRPFDWWKPIVTTDSWVRVDLGSLKTADYFAFASHDIFTQGGQIKLQRSADLAFTSPIDVVDITPTEDRVYYESFTQVSSQYWRVLITGSPTAPPLLGVVSFGVKVTLEKGFRSGYAPAAQNEDVRYSTSLAENGKFLGSAIVRKGYPESFTIPEITPGWVTSFWDAFKTHAVQFPFFLSWDETLHSDEAIFTQIDGALPSSNFDTELTQSITLSHRGNLT